MRLLCLSYVIRLHYIYLWDSYVCLKSLDYITSTYWVDTQTTEEKKAEFKAEVLYVSFFHNSSVV